MTLMIVHDPSREDTMDLSCGLRVLRSLLQSPRPTAAVGRRDPEASRDPSRENTTVLTSCVNASKSRVESERGGKGSHRQ